MASPQPIQPSRNDALTSRDAQPLQSVDEIWRSLSQMAPLGIFILLLGACLYVCRPILLPVSAAFVIGTTLAPIVKAARRRGVPPPVTAIAIVVVLLGAAGIGAMLLAAPVSEWISRAPGTRSSTRSATRSASTTRPGSGRIVRARRSP